MGPTANKQTSDKQIKQPKNKQTTQITQTKNTQKAKEEHDGDKGHLQLGVVGSVRGNSTRKEDSSPNPATMTYTELKAALRAMTDDELDSLIA